MDKGEQGYLLFSELGSIGSRDNDFRKPRPPQIQSTPILVQSTSTLDASCEVTEVDVKADIKCEPNYDCSENSDSTSDLATCLGLKEENTIDSDDPLSISPSLPMVVFNGEECYANNNKGNLYMSRVTMLLKNKLQQRKTFYYIKSIILQCPACATPFKGGRTRLPCLLNHIAKKHCKMRSTLSRVIKDRYGVKEVCDCFACTSNRAHGLK